MNNELREVLEAIKRTDNLRAKINKEIGVKKTTEAPNDMYEFTYKKDDLTHTNWIILHGRCVEAGCEKLLKAGYVLTQIKHYTTDAGFFRVQCNHCKEVLDSAEETKYLKNRKVRLEQRHREWEEEKAIREEWEAEQVLLGKL